MARRIRIIGSLACIAIFVVALIAVFSTSGESVGRTKDLVPTETGDTYLVLKWEPQDKVDGYQIFVKAEDGEDFYVAETVEDANTATATVKGLQAGSEYRVYVAGYKGSGDNAKTGKKSDVLKIKTLFKRPQITLESKSKGELKVIWKTQKDAAGYEIVYRGLNDFKSGVVEGNKETEAVFTECKSGVKYRVRVRSYFYQGDEKLYSPWSDIEEIVIASKKPAAQ